MERRFVMGDIHGAHRALLQCLQRAEFNFNVDHLIFLGDVCDGWPDTNLCIETLLKIKNLTFILGNHDWWMLKWIRTGRVDKTWHAQGGKATIESYPGNDVPMSHFKLLESALPYQLVNNNLFVHAGITRDMDLSNQTEDIFLWDRSLVTTAMAHFTEGEFVQLTPYEKIFVGHTPVASGQPIKACEVWLMDTGAGWSGVLSMMNLDTEEIFTSDTVPSLYPGVEGRTRKKN